MSLTQADLLHFIGSEQLWHHPPISFKYTDGIRYVVREGNAYWLLADISAHQHQPAIVEYAKSDWFQSWKLCVKEDKSATLTCGDGNGNILFTHAYACTDFPLSETTFYLVDGILLLPSEY